MINPLVFALISYFAWAVGDIFGTFASRKLGGFSTTVWSLFLRLIIFTLYLPFELAHFKDLTPGLFLIIIAIAIIGLIGFVAFNEGMKVGNPALVGTIAAAFPFITVIISVVLFKEILTIQQIAAISIIFIGITLSSFDLKLLREGEKLHRGVGLALITMMTWGIWFAFIRIPVGKIGWFLPNYIIYGSFPLVLLFMKIKNIPLLPLTRENAAIPLIVAAFLLGIAELSYNLGITFTQASIIAPIAGAYPTLFVILAFLVFKDPITKQQIAGIVVTLIGIVLLSILSS